MLSTLEARESKENITAPIIMLDAIDYDAERLLKPFNLATSESEFKKYHDDFNLEFKRDPKMIDRVNSKDAIFGAVMVSKIDGTPIRSGAGDNNAAFVACFTYKNEILAIIVKYYAVSTLGELIAKYGEPKIFSITGIFELKTWANKNLIMYFSEHNRDMAIFDTNKFIGVLKAMSEHVPRTH